MGYLHIIADIALNTGHIGFIITKSRQNGKQCLSFRSSIIWICTVFSALSVWILNFFMLVRLVLQFWRGKRINCPYFSKLSTFLRQNSDNESSQRMFLTRMKKNCLWFILDTLSYQELWLNSLLVTERDWFVYLSLPVCMSLSWNSLFCFSSLIIYYCWCLWFLFIIVS